MGPACHHHHHLTRCIVTHHLGLVEHFKYRTRHYDQELVITQNFFIVNSSVRVVFCFLFSKDCTLGKEGLVDTLQDLVNLCIFLHI